MNQFKMADCNYEYDNGEFEEEDEAEGIEKLESITEDTKKANSVVRVVKIDGIAQIYLSKLTQEIIGCKVNEDVTTEYPWIFVDKEKIEDNLDLHFENSDFFPIRNDIFEYPFKEILIGLVTTTITSKLNNDEFYICLTENSRNTVMKQRDLLRDTQENRVKNSVFRPINQWHELGSNKEIDHLSIKRERPLLEIKMILHKRADSLKVPIQLIDFDANESKDSCIEIINTRQSFNHITKKIASLAESNYPRICDNNAQTLSLKCLNAWFQYSYDFKLINTETYNDEEAREIEKFLRIHTINLYHQVVMNTVWDIYIDDCEKLIKSNKDIQLPIPAQYMEYQSFHNIELTENKVISNLSWHPLLTRIAAVTYTNNSKSHISTPKNYENKILKACHENNYVLIWSLNDCLSPKLILECSREVAIVSFKPMIGNYVVGGCFNGQIAIWCITDELKKIQESTLTSTITTTTQLKYKIITRNFMNWMKDQTGVTIHPIAMSSMKKSQKNCITNIIWLSVCTKIGKNGRFTQLSKNITDDQEYLDDERQFVTSSEDGTIVFWNLRIQKKNSDENEIKLNKPSKQLDDTFTPIYMLKVKHFNAERSIVITTMCFYVPKYEKSCQNENMQKTIFIGTLEGDVGMITWDGFEYATDLTINNGEVTSWIWYNNSIHNGPVSHSVRSKYLNDVILTVGGTVFAVWRQDFGIPVFMKKSLIRYSACSWGTSRPTVIILARTDGSIEIWDLIVKTHEACFIQNLSGSIITGIYTHELHLNPQCVAFCDFNGAMRIFNAPPNLLIFQESDVEWMKLFVDREIDRINEFEKWKNYYIMKKTSKENNKQKRADKQENMENKSVNFEEKNTKIIEIGEKMTSPLKIENAGKFIEKENHWRSMELKRMQRIILEKKRLRAKDLDIRQAPVLKLCREAKLKQKRINKIIQNKDQIFEETVNFIFPEQDDATADDDDDYQYTAYLSLKNESQIEDKFDYSDTELNRKIIIPDDQKIINKYREISKEMLKEMEKYSSDDAVFNWQEMMKEGEHRRHLLDIDLRNIQKKRTRAPLKLI